MHNRKSKTEYLFGLFFFFILYSTAHSQEALARQVVDALSNEPVPFAECTVVSTGVKVRSDEWGRVEVRCAVDDTIEVRNLGYAGRVRAGDSPWRIASAASSVLGTTVVAFRNNRSNLSTPGTIGLISGVLLNATDQTSLQNALNTIPGVQMDSRGYGGSQRINIRGSFLRSPTAVRNIRMYMNGIPLASPDGTAPLELMDAWDIGRIEVIKGPAGSLWGSGTGGVLLISPKKATKEGWNVAHQQMHGMFGLQRYTQAVEWKKGSWNMRLSHVYQDNDGYRLQEFNRKHQVSLSLHWDATEKLSYFLYATAYTGHLGLPGALNSNLAEVNPTSANSFSLTNNASLYRSRALAGLSQTWQVSTQWRNTTSVYAVTSDKRNPYGTQRGTKWLQRRAQHRGRHALGMAR
jgi:iron complex outermembrane recepter protein